MKNKGKPLKPASRTEEKKKTRLILHSKRENSAAKGKRGEQSKQSMNVSKTRSLAIRPYCTRKKDPQPAARKGKRRIGLKREREFCTGRTHKNSSHSHDDHDDQAHSRNQKTAPRKIASPDRHRAPDGEKAAIV